MAFFSSKTSEVLGDKLGRASSTLRAFIQDVQHARNEAIDTQVQAEQEIESLFAVKNGAAAIEEQAINLLDVLGVSDVEKHESSIKDLE